MILLTGNPWAGRTELRGRTQQLSGVRVRMAAGVAAGTVNTKDTKEPLGEMIMVYVSISVWVAKVDAFATVQ